LESISASWSAVALSGRHDCFHRSALENGAQHKPHCRRRTRAQFTCPITSATSPCAAAGLARCTTIIRSLDIRTLTGDRIQILLAVTLDIAGTALALLRATASNTVTASSVS